MNIFMGDFLIERTVTEKKVIFVESNFFVTEHNSYGKDIFSFYEYIEGYGNLLHSLHCAMDVLIATALVQDIKDQRIKAIQVLEAKKFCKSLIK